MQLTRLPHPSPTPDATRESLIADPGFGTVFTDHMVTIDYDEALGGWQTPTVGPRQPIPLDPAASVLHYAQEIFEGLKAYRHPDGAL
ncbi:MAG TPA: branched chain amino acid aminotransferase, partial [Erythrobacter sp.]